MANYTVNLRSFAPWSEFGGGFMGDNRGFSLAPSGTDQASSRVHASFDVDTDLGRVSELYIWSDASHGPDHFIGPMKSLNGSPGGQMQIEMDGNKIHLSLNVEGANPLVSFSPDIDLKLDMSIAETNDLLKIDTMIGGDLFPAAEVLISQGQETVWLGGFSPENKSALNLIKLYGSGEELDKDNFHSSVQIEKNSEGSFTGVSGGFGRTGELLEQGEEQHNLLEVVSIHDWNNEIMSRVPLPNDIQSVSSNIFDNSDSGGDFSDGADADVGGAASDFSSESSNTTDPIWSQGNLNIFNNSSNEKGNYYTDASKGGTDSDYSEDTVIDYWGESENVTNDYWDFGSSNIFNSDLVSSEDTVIDYWGESENVTNDYWDYGSSNIFNSDSGSSEDTVIDYWGESESVTNDYWDFGSSNIFTSDFGNGMDDLGTNILGDTAYDSSFDSQSFDSVFTSDWNESVFDSWGGWQTNSTSLWG